MEVFLSTGFFRRNKDQLLLPCEERNISLYEKCETKSTMHDRAIFLGVGVGMFWFIHVTIEVLYEINTI